MSSGTAVPWLHHACIGHKRVLITLHSTQPYTAANQILQFANYSKLAPIYKPDYQAQVLTGEIASVSDHEVSHTKNRGRHTMNGG